MGLLRSHPSLHLISVNIDCKNIINIFRTFMMVFEKDEKKIATVVCHATQDTLVLHLIVQIVVIRCLFSPAIDGVPFGIDLISKMNKQLRDDRWQELSRQQHWTCADELRRECDQNREMMRGKSMRALK